MGARIANSYANARPYANVNRNSSPITFANTAIMKSPFTNVPLGSFAPDLNPLTKGIVTDCNWAWRTPGGWRAMELPANPDISAPQVANRCSGAFSFLSGIINQEPWNILTAQGDPNIYIAQPGNFAADGIQATPNTNLWSFDVYGQDVIAVNGVDPPLVLSQPGQGGKFAFLAGNPPVAAIVVATDFSLFLIPPVSELVWFSQSDALWTPNNATGTGNFPLSATSGNIVAGKALRGGCLLFKNASTYFGIFQGPPLFWQFNKVSPVIGTLGINCPVVVDTLCYFISREDFYYTDGFSLYPIATPTPVRNFFFANLDPNNSQYVSGVYDPQHKQILWWYPSVNGVAAGLRPGTLDSYIGYSLLTGDWVGGNVVIDLPVTGNFPLQYLSFVAQPPNTAGHLLLNTNPNPPAESTTYPQVSGFSFVTSADLGDNQSIYRITRARPQMLSYPGLPGNPPPPVLGLTSPVLQLQSRYIMGGPIDKTVNVGMNQITGFWEMLTANRLHRCKILMPADMEIAGLDVEMSDAGRI